MNGTHRVLAGLALGLGFSTSGAAATLDQSFNAEALAIASSCAARVTITRGAEADRIVVHAAAEHPEEIDALRFTTQARSLQIGHRPVNGPCWRPADGLAWEPTLMVMIAVPAGTPIAISEGGAPRYAITGVSGPLQVSLAGAAVLRADAVRTLAATLSGAPDVAIGSVDGPVSLDVDGAGAVEMDRLVAPSLRIAATGRVSIDLRQARVGAVSIDDKGSGHVAVAGSVDTAAVSLIGSGTVTLPRPAGASSKQVIGSGTVSFGP